MEIKKAPGLFAKHFGPLVSTWHKKGTNITVHIDDGAVTDYTYDCDVQASRIIKNILFESGFVLKERKIPMGSY